MCYAALRAATGHHGGIGMRRNLIIGALLALTAGCSSFTRPERFVLTPIMVSGTTYEVFQLVRSVDRDYSDPRNDPRATVAVYVTVGPGVVIYCGPTAARCATLIRQFNEGDTTLVEGMRRNGM